MAVKIVRGRHLESFAQAGGRSVELAMFEALTAKSEQAKSTLLMQQILPEKCGWSVFEFFNKIGGSRTFAAGAK
ncbi:hypothetical protein FHS72_003742 [Loktanella ponticola]|uniref:Uncharacterized protein n=1 Tax=Yoonia ponticola TaxID=1524255 RepID=A0A7W9BP59_9RHOB|nr:hypothetical protein [Yoonia ponticola]MBB5724085.1 hypothetical protein [Yoonia ponticola]